MINIFELWNKYRPANVRKLIAEVGTLSSALRSAEIAKTQAENNCDTCRRLLDETRAYAHKLETKSGAIRIGMGAVDGEIREKYTVTMEIDPYLLRYHTHSDVRRQEVLFHSIARHLAHEAAHAMQRRRERC